MIRLRVLRASLSALALSFAGLVNAQPQADAVKSPPAAETVAAETPDAPKSPPAKTDAEILDVLNRVAKHQLRPLADGEYPKVASIAEASSVTLPVGITWNYPWGVTLYGLQRSTDVTHDKEAMDFVLKHNAIIAREFDWVMSLKKVAKDDAEWKAFATNRRMPLRSLINLGNLDSCGSMGNQFIESMLRAPDQVTDAHKGVAERIVDYVFNKQQRTEADHVFWRPKSTDEEKEMSLGTLWIDDLYMGGPVLVRYGKFTKDDKYLHDVANNILGMAKRLQDTDGVWYHAYFENDKKHSPFKWGRANGWAMVAAVEVLSEMPEDHPDRAALLDELKRHIEGIKPLQAESGMWRQILDHPELWEETSCTAMFGYSIARAVNRGWIDKSNMAVARKAFEGISTYVTPEGVVNGTCRGTNIGMTIDYYANRPRPSDDLHGRGVVLLAGTEILDGAKK